MDKYPADVPEMKVLVSIGHPAGDNGALRKYRGSRTPKADLTKTLADFFDISPDALTVPDIDTDIGLMHTLFALEDIRGLTIGEIDGEVCLRLDKSKGKTYTNMLDMLSAWAEQAKKLEAAA